MHLSRTIISSLFLATAALSQYSSLPTIGYTCRPHCITPTVPPSNANLTFGRNYAVLNLDLVSLVGDVANTTAGFNFINSNAVWVDFIHAQHPTPLSIFTRIAYSNSRQPELGPHTPFAEKGSKFGDASDPVTYIYPAFHVDEAAGDVVLLKQRYYAGWGNSLETILKAQEIDTVILSGYNLGGVILNSVYTLFNLDYKVYVIANNTIQTGSEASQAYQSILEGIIPALPADVITLEQAMKAVKRSGPAIW